MDSVYLEWKKAGAEAQSLADMWRELLDLCKAWGPRFFNLPVRCSEYSFGELVGLFAEKVQALVNLIDGISHDFGQKGEKEISVQIEDLVWEAEQLRESVRVLESQWSGEETLALLRHTDHTIDLIVETARKWVSCLDAYDTRKRDGDYPL